MTPAAWVGTPPSYRSGRLCERMMAADRLIELLTGGSYPSCDQLAENSWQCVEQISRHQSLMAGEVRRPAVEPGAGGGGPESGKAHRRQGADDAGEDVAGPGGGEPRAAGGVDGGPPRGIGHDRSEERR